MYLFMSSDWLYGAPWCRGWSLGTGSCPWPIWIDRPVPFFLLFVIQDHRATHSWSQNCSNMLPGPGGAPGGQVSVLGALGVISFQTMSVWNRLCLLSFITDWIAKRFGALSWTLQLSLMAFPAQPCLYEMPIYAWVWSRC